MFWRKGRDVGAEISLATVLAAIRCDGPPTFCVLQIRQAGRCGTSWTQAHRTFREPGTNRFRFRFAADGCLQALSFLQPTERARARGEPQVRYICR